MAAIQQRPEGDDDVNRTGLMSIIKPVHSNMLVAVMTYPGVVSRRVITFTSGTQIGKSLNLVGPGGVLDKLKKWQGDTFILYFDWRAAEKVPSIGELNTIPGMVQLYRHSGVVGVVVLNPDDNLGAWASSFSSEGRVVKFVSGTEVDSSFFATLEEEIDNANKG